MCDLYHSEILVVSNRKLLFIYSYNWHNHNFFLFWDDHESNIKILVLNKISSAE